MASIERVKLFQRLIERVLGYFGSEHGVLCLKLVTVDVREPRPFRFQPYWLSEEKLMSQIEGWWVG